jgi:hypothetical protein
MLSAQKGLKALYWLAHMLQQQRQWAQQGWHHHAEAWGAASPRPARLSTAEAMSLFMASILFLGQKRTATPSS